jgi:hypothetical protein
MEDVSANEEASFPLGPYLEALITETKQHPPGMAVGRHPVPIELTALFKTPQLGGGEVLSNRLLKTKNVDSLLLHIVA